MTTTNRLGVCIISLVMLIAYMEAEDVGDHLVARYKRAESVCLLQPEIEEGPYYRNMTSYRSNIIEDRQGIPLHIIFTVIDTNNCSILPNAAIDLWHCDALGVYSHFIAASLGTGSQNDNSTFLRGLQISSSTGVASFNTIYPGWYDGRAAHIYLKVHVGGVFINSTGVYSGGHISHTGQLFFNDTLTDLVKATWPYSNNTHSRTYNNVDRVYTQQNGYYSVLNLSYVNVTVGISAGIIGSITLGINSSAIPAAVSSNLNNGGVTSTTTTTTTTTTSTTTSTITSKSDKTISLNNLFLFLILNVICLTRFFMF